MRMNKDHEKKTYTDLIKGKRFDASGIWRGKIINFVIPPMMRNITHIVTDL